MDVVAMDSFVINNIAEPINFVPPSFFGLISPLILQSF
jgi:hypothetical protein